METTQEQTHKSGYLDSLMLTFSALNHPVVLVGNSALVWNGGRTIPDHFTFLVDATTVEELVISLLKTGEWNSCKSPKIRYYWNPPPRKDGYWLRTTLERGLGVYGVQFLHLVTEEQYMMDVKTCVFHGLQVPDASVNFNFVIGQDEEYYRDKLERFGPRRFSKPPVNLRPVLFPVRARSAQTEHIPIYVPCIADHVNALLDQARFRRESRFDLPTDPKDCIHRIIEGVYLDWVEAKEWFLNEKVEERNKEDMLDIFNKFKRKRYRMYKLDGKFVFRLPWEPPPGESPAPSE